VRLRLVFALLCALGGRGGATQARDVCVMVKQSEQKVGSLKRGAKSADECYNLYALRTLTLETLVNELRELG
jgi:hypothetical protein